MRSIWWRMSISNVWMHLVRWMKKCSYKDIQTMRLVGRWRKIKPGYEVIRNSLEKHVKMILMILWVISSTIHTPDTPNEFLWILQWKQFVFFLWWYDIEAVKSTHSIKIHANLLWAPTENWVIIVKLRFSVHQIQIEIVGKWLRIWM